MSHIFLRANRRNLRQKLETNSGFRATQIIQLHEAMLHKSWLELATF